MTDSHGQEVPVVTSPVIGYRSWRIVRDPFNVPNALTPRFRGSVPWRPGTNTARCLRYPSHEAPVSGCGCGLYAYHDAGLTGTDYAIGDVVVGAVVGWGAMEVYYDGWRAEHARIVALASVDYSERVIGEVAALYHVPVIPIDAVTAGWRVDWSPLVRKAKKYGEALHDSLLPEKPINHELVCAIQQLQVGGAFIACVRLSGQARRGEVRVNRVEQPRFDYASFFSQGQRTEIVPASIAVCEVVVHPDDYKAMGMWDVRKIYGIPVEYSDEEVY